MESKPLFQRSHFLSTPTRWIVGRATLSAINLQPQCVIYTLAEFGRVPTGCGYYFETSPNPPTSSDSARHKSSKSVFNLSLAPADLHLSTPSLSTSRSSTGLRFRPSAAAATAAPGRTGLLQRPDMVGQARRHCQCTRAAITSPNRRHWSLQIGQRLARAHVGQYEIMIDVK